MAEHFQSVSKLNVGTNVEENPAQTSVRSYAEAATLHADRAIPPLEKIDFTRAYEESYKGYDQPPHTSRAVHKIKLRWDQNLPMFGIGAGLKNLGNSCFINATLQILTHTPPLVNYLLSSNYNCQCISNSCMRCVLKLHITRAFNNSGSAISPDDIVANLNSIDPRMRVGRQEDAHEFLRHLIEAVNKSCLNTLSSTPSNTVISKIFSGSIHSQVECADCHGISHSYEMFNDLGIDIKILPSIKKGLDKLVTPLTLNGDNAFECTTCQQKVAAKKTMSIHTEPRILTIQLKRFDFKNSSSHKINRFVTYPFQLDLQPYMPSKKEPVLYSLFGVIVHDGTTCHSGHYYSLLKAKNGAWYLMNDSHVVPMSCDDVLKQNAYILFYAQLPKPVISRKLINSPGVSPPVVESSTSLPMASAAKNTSSPSAPHPPGQSLPFCCLYP